MMEDEERDRLLAEIAKLKDANECLEAEIDRCNATIESMRNAETKRKADAVASHNNTFWSSHN